MHPLRYALVAYLKDPVGEFVEQLRRELHPPLSYLAAHLTVLPPRMLQTSELAALDALEEACGRVTPFEITLGEVESFVPVTPTVFISLNEEPVFCELHRQFNTGALQASEEWPYIPHLTIVKMERDAEAEAAFFIARDRWAQYRGPRRTSIHEFTFVRELETNVWVDLAGFPLGRSLVSRQDF
jgi:2'-5' RNA ligase